VPAGGADAGVPGVCVPVAAGAAAGCDEAGADDAGAAGADEDGTVGAGATGDAPSPSRSRAGASERMAGVRFMSSLSVPDPLIMGRVETSTVLIAASSISDVVRPIVVIEPI